jgi:glycosyltransferase involved in cell wall biosynthesis
MSYLPRKLAGEARDVVELLRLRGALDGWEVESISDVDEVAYAAVLRRSRVFLCFSHREGFGLPPLEAMASGCIVVGFDGVGGRELFRHHGISVENGDVLAMAQAAEQVLRGWKTNPASFERAATEASEFARSTFSLERERSDVLSVFGHFLELAGDGERRVSHGALEEFWRVPSRWRVAGHHLRKAREALFGSRQ